MKTFLYSLSIFLILSASAQVIVNQGAYIATSGGVYLSTEGLSNESRGNIHFGEGNTIISGALINDGSVNVNGSLAIDGGITNSSELIIGNYGSLLNKGTVAGADLTLNKSILANGPKYLSSPVVGALSAAFNGAFLYKYDEVNSDWNAVTSTSEVLQTMNGYSAQFISDKELSFSGLTNTGDLTKSLSAAGDGWNLLGNPYPSAFDWDKVELTNVGNAIYMWNSSGQNYTTYLGSASEAGVAVNVDRATDASIVPKMQAFFVKASGTSPTVELKNDSRVHSTKEVVGNERMLNAPEQCIRLRIVGKYYSDEIAIRVHPKATAGFDPELDAFKLLSPAPEIPQLYSYNANNEQMAINSFHIVDGQMTIPIGLITPDNNEWLIETVESTLGYTEVFLYDRLKDKAISIVLEPYAFQGTQSTLDERFELRFVNSITGFDLDFKELSILSLKSGISFRNIPNTQNTEITVFELSGRKLLKQSLTLHQDETFTYQPKLPTGIYIYNLVFGGELFEGRMKIE